MEMASWVRQVANSYIPVGGVPTRGERLRLTSFKALSAARTRLSYNFLFPAQPPAMISASRSFRMRHDRLPPVQCGQLLTQGGALQ
jgi:hypothetical protein